MRDGLDMREWLEPDGLGGFASGTVSGVRTRRYHALLLHADTPPTGRFVLVNGYDAWLHTPGGTFALTAHAYPNGVVYPNGQTRRTAFETRPWPRWTYRCEDGSEIHCEVLSPHGTGRVLVAWTLHGSKPGAKLSVRPFLSGRDYHALHHENPAFAWEPKADGERLLWTPYAGVPAIGLLSNGEYRHGRDWYRRFRYAAEAQRGLDSEEDLAAPGTLWFDLAPGPAVMVWAGGACARDLPTRDARDLFEQARRSETTRRAAFKSRLDHAAQSYLVRRGNGLTLVAGYPWFTDWGRDTFTALRGLCLERGRIDEARDILCEWAHHLHDGVLPNRFADSGEPELNSVDAGLWFVVAAHAFLEAEPRAKRDDVRALTSAIEQVVAAYARGARHGIRMDAEGLLCAGEPGVALTWMDAQVKGRPVTPRIGKPVEVQALWLNALWVASQRAPERPTRWNAILKTAHSAFEPHFWNAQAECLYDVVDVDGRPGAVDASVRPNQIFAVGGLPFQTVRGSRAEAIVQCVVETLWTPLGLRTLAPDDRSYRGRYEGGPEARDEAYHQGTVWPWLTGALVEAFLRTHATGGRAATTEARDRFLAGLLAHLDDAGIDHVSEIADADAPHAPRGCPFQAWSVAELIRSLSLVGAWASKG